MSEADKAYASGCILVYAKDLEKENAELKSKLSLAENAIAESREQEPIGEITDTPLVGYAQIRWFRKIPTRDMIGTKLYAAPIIKEKI